MLLLFPVSLACGPCRMVSDKSWNMFKYSIFFCLGGPQSGMVFWSGINFPYIRAKQNRKKRNQWLASRVLGQLWRIGSDAWGFRRSKRTLGPWLCRTSPEPCPSKRSEKSGGKKSRKNNWSDFRKNNWMVLKWLKCSYYQFHGFSANVRFILIQFKECKVSVCAEIISVTFCIARIDRTNHPRL